MKSRIPFVVLALLFAALIAVGCRSMLAGPGGVSATPTPTPTADGALPDGFFVDGSHDVDGGGPPPTPDEAENIGEETQSHFRAIQVDPLFEDTAGPKFVRSADMNGDGLLDVITGHNQSQAVQLHLQGSDADGNVVFDTINLGGNMPVTVIAGLEVADMDQDGAPDVVVLIKHTGITAFCFDGEPNEDMFTGMLMILFSPLNGDITDGDQWMQVRLQDSHPAYSNRWGEVVETGRAIDYPENGGYTSLAVADIDQDSYPDIVATSNVPEPECGSGINAVELWLNPGPARVRDGSHFDIAADGPADLNNRSDLDFWYPIWILGEYPLVLNGTAGEVDPVLDDSGNLVDPVTGLAIITDVAPVKDCAIMDVDDDGDLDIVSTWTNTTSLNVRWHRNPLVEEGLDAFVNGLYFNTNGENVTSTGVVTLPDSIALLSTSWERRPIGQIDGEAGIIALGDMDNDGFTDVFVRDSESNTALWFRRPTNDTEVDPTFPPDNPDAGAGDNTPTPDRFNFTWQVYAMDAFDQYRPNGIAVGDLTGDGMTDAAVAVGGALYWYDHTVTTSNSPFDEWGRDFVLDDTKLNGTTDDPTDIDFADDGTLLNDLLVVDLDGDGVNDLLATFDRRVEGGLADDTIIWFRNTLFDESAAD